MIPLHKYSYPFVGQFNFSPGAFILLVDVTTLRVKLTCGKFNWLGMIWKGTHILIKGLTADKITSPEVKITACRAQKQVLVKRHIWGRVQKKIDFIEGSQKQKLPLMEEVRNNQDSS